MELREIDEKDIPVLERYEPKKDIPNKLVSSAVEDNPSCIDVYWQDEYGVPYLRLFIRPKIFNIGDLVSDSVLLSGTHEFTKDVDELDSIVRSKSPLSDFDERKSLGYQIYRYSYPINHRSKICASVEELLKNHR